MATGDFLLQHNAEVTVVHRESGDSYGPFRTKGGGGKTGENTLVRPGGMAAPVAAAGTYGYDEVTVGMALRFETHSGIFLTFAGRHGERFDITAQALDSKGRSGFHKPESASGLLNGSTPAELDADGNDPQTLELVFTIDTVT